MRNLAEKDEVDCLNFLIIIFKQMLEPKCSTMVATIRQVVQQQRYSEYNLGIAKILQKEVERFKKLLQIELFTCQKGVPYQENAKNLKDSIMTRFNSIFSENKVWEIQR